MRDRQPTNPGRVLLTPENGEAPFYATMEMADDPTDLGTPPTKANLLTDEAETALFGSPADRTVDQAFKGIAARLKLIASNMATITLAVKSSAGNPLAGVQINGTFDDNGAALITNASGVATGYVSEGIVTLSVSGYGDIEDHAESFTAEKGVSYNKTVTLKPRNFLLLDTSKNVKFSGNVSRVDVTAVGGGGGGGGSYAGRGAVGCSGGGGGGGACVVKESVAFTPNTIYSAVVGSGGIGGAKNQSTEGAGTNGGTGGSSSVLGITANGGNGGGTASKSTAGSAGSGNGAGGAGKRQIESGYAAGSNGVAGGTLGFASFTTTARYGGGGGGGAVKYKSNVSGVSGGAGGADFGGAGGAPASAGMVATGYGGGGGGAGGNYSDDYADGAAGGSGYRGCIAFRMHLKSA